MKQWKTLSKKVILERNKFLTVEDHTIKLPDGRVISDWPWVITPDFVNIVALSEDNKFLCFRQTKYAIEGTSLAPIGGYIDPGEDPLSAARRELLEETGYESNQWTPLGSFPVDANRGCGTGYFFLARGACNVATANKDDLEEQKLLLLSRQEVDDAISRGEFRILPWALALCLALMFLDKQPK
jgi:ADP-ribose pyrophosphatase